MCGAAAAAADHWVTAAMADDAMVVEVLLCLHKPRLLQPAPLPLNWTVRQRRSRPVSAASNQKKPARRASPATPLSWSGATSLSGSGGGDEESSRPPRQNASAVARSKVISDVERTASKRSRKKKTLAELRDEERSLLKEKRELKRDLAALRENLEKEKTTNEKLKRMKAESQPLPDGEISIAQGSNSNQLPQKTTLSTYPHILPIIPMTSSNIHEQKATDTASNSKFALPDLNIPFDDSPCPEVTCGVS